MRYDSHVSYGSAAINGSRTSTRWRPSGRSMSDPTSLNQRKLDHIQACMDDAVDLQRDSFALLKLRYCAFPELALDEVSTTSEFAGKPTAAPLIISSMTGGVGEEFTRINRNLAQA